MSEVLRTLAPYVPPNIVRATLAEAAAGAPPEPPAEAAAEAYEAAVLFADVSGFTPLTEALAQKGGEGPEEMTRLLNSYFSRMIALIEAEGGEVVKFSGDAVTVVFPVRPPAGAGTAGPFSTAAGSVTLAKATRRAVQAAEAMQAAMVAFATLETSAGPVSLGMKIGVGAGRILAARVGGLSSRWEYVIAGDPLRQVAEAEDQAGRGDIILSPEAEALIHPASLPQRPVVQPDWGQISKPEAIEAVLRNYVPGAILAWMGGGLQAWLAVLRPMTVLFISVAGLDYGQPDAIERLHRFLQSAQEIIDQVEGSINKLAVDDKGTIMLGLFGAPPYAHEDDPVRALRCALDLQAMARQQSLSLAIGAATGRVFAGPVGSDTRREYTVMGDTVNLAARLMTVAGPGQIRCDYETYRISRDHLTFDLLDPVRVKGKAGLIRIYRPTSETGRQDQPRAQGALIGRRQELGILSHNLDQVKQGHSRSLIVEGEAGIGKSRLVQELIRLMREQGVSGLRGTGRSVEQQTPYRAWRDIFNSYFDLDETEDPLVRQARVQDEVEEVAPEMVERIPLLNDVLGLGLPENDLTRSLDTETRHESLVSLLLALLRAWCAERPLVIILEDAHWLDTLSWDLTLQAARTLTVAHVPLLLVVVMRPLVGETMRVEATALAGMEETERLELGLLPPEEMLDLAAARLGVTAGDMPRPVVDLIRQRAGGNPFFAEELIYVLRDNELITVETDKEGQARCRVSGDLTQTLQALPDTIQGLILSRIDRLPPEEQMALRVAAVIGRTFGYTILSDTLGRHMEISQRLLRIYMDDLTHRELTPIEAPEPELTYIFKHIITQEVAYETLLFAQRRQLHRTVAEWYEHNFDPDQRLTQTIAAGRLPDQPLEAKLAPYYPLLVYHWRQAEERNRERIYARLAGQMAAAQFANVEAAGYFSRALALTPEEDLSERYDLLLAREAVNDLQAEREAQATDLELLADLAQQLQDGRRQAEVSLRRANYAEALSDYPALLAAARQAVIQAVQVDDHVAEAEGYIFWGKALWRQAEYEAAREKLTQALELARRTGNHAAEARSFYYTGHAYLYQNNYPDAQARYQQALDLYQTVRHRQGVADCLNMLGIIHYETGDFPVAGTYYEQVLQIFRTIGDRRGETIPLGNLGLVYCDLGEYATARDYQEQAVALCRSIGDRSGEAMGLTNLGLVYHKLGENDLARQQCEQALAIQRDIGDRRTEGYSLTYLGHALAGLGQLAAAAAAYTEAMTLRRELGQHSLVMDDLAGLAEVLLAQGDTGQARSHIDEVVAWLEANGTAGIDYPLQVYFTCYRVLQAGGNGSAGAGQQARRLLGRAYDVLMEQASGISDAQHRRSFLENVRPNRDIVAAWQAAG